MTQSSFPFDGAVALVTGAASGIGQALVAALQAQGVKVAGADLSAPAGPDLALALDIRSRSDWAAAADRVGETFGGADLLFNVAGICASPQPIHEVELETFQRVLDTNLVGMFHGTQVFVNQLRRTGRSAHIVNICSVCGLFSTPGYAAYAASKTATVSLSETARSDLAPLGIGVTAVCPGYVNTAIASSGQDSTSENRRRVAEIMANSMQPEEVARRIIEAVSRNLPYLLPHPEYDRVIAARAAMLDAALVTARELDAGGHPIDDVTRLGGSWL
jgi:NAD(P)-dependent dehydrogenase (short-subunit alcohol dehydrogenase family)